MESETAAHPDSGTGEWIERGGPPPAGVEELAAATTIVAELLCERIDLHPGQVVLDVATGSGNGALSAARRGCEARGVDSIPALLERARERARAERLRARFQLGSVDAIPFPDESFDVVLSALGVMLAPDPLGVIKELLRVCRPGGRIALANWTPESFIGVMLRHADRQVLPGQRLADMTAWGTEGGIRGLFGDHVRSLEVRTRAFVFRCRSPEHFLELMRTGESSALLPLRVSRDPDHEVIERDLRAIVHRFNRAQDGSMVVPSDYLEAVAIKL